MTAVTTATALTMRATHGSRQGRQGGVMLLEALIAILIFSIGILSVVGMQASAVKASSDAKFRSDASLLGNELIGQMWVSDPTTLQANFSDPSGTKYTAWLANVQAALPGVTGSANLPTVNVAANGMVTLSIFWKLPSDPDSAPAHNYVVVVQIR